MSDFSGLFGFGLFQKHELVWRRYFNDSPWGTDCDGRRINRADYGLENSLYGWEIDHIIPSAAGGSDDMINLRPRHCSGNRSAGALFGNALRTPPKGGPF